MNDYSLYKNTPYEIKEQLAYLHVECLVHLRDVLEIVKNEVEFKNDNDFTIVEKILKKEGMLVNISHGILKINFFFPTKLRRLIKGNSSYYTMNSNREIICYNVFKPINNNNNNKNLFSEAIPLRDQLETFNLKTFLLELERNIQEINEKVELTREQLKHIEQLRIRHEQITKAKKDFNNELSPLLANYFDLDVK